jgi:hypothetical protein
MKYDDPLIEHLANLEHKQWMQWAQNIMDTEPGLSEKRRKRWKELMVPYDQLPDEWKEFDREWARKVLWRVGVAITDLLESDGDSVDG